MLDVPLVKRRLLIPRGIQQSSDGESSRRGESVEPSEVECANL